ncbi:MAG: efflux RND transporter permease subunit, partial [Luteimonas sp.]
MVLSDISIRRPVFATVINLVVLLVGIIAYDRLAVRLIPNVDTPVVTVNTNYPGASAQVIETQVTQPIEDALSGVEGIEYIQSVSREQSSQVTIRFRLDRDPDGAASDVRDRVGTARDFLPEEADEPVVQKQEADAQPIIYMAFSSPKHSQVELADLAERLVKDRVQTIPGVAQAQVFSSTYAMRIWLQPQRLAGFGLTPVDVENALRAQNVEIPAGRVESAAREFTVLSETDLRTPEQFGEIIVGNGSVGSGSVGITDPSNAAIRGMTSSDTYLVRLKDVAKVELGAQEDRFRARYNGEDAVPLGVVKQAVANPLDISKALKEMLPQIQKTLPDGVKVDIAYDSTIFIEESISEVYTTVGIAIVLVVLVIFLFLRSWRATLIPLVTIPVSLVGAFALMYAFGFTINTLTLLAMVLAIGLVVDDAIVMLENIYRHVEEGMPPMQAALQGSKEIGFAIVAMTLTLAAVYLPLAFSTGRTGKLFVEFALTLAGAVLVSGFTALTLSPMMSSKLLKHETQHGRFYETGEKALHWIDRSYRGVLQRALSLRWAVTAVAALVFAAALALFMQLPRELAPPEDQGFIIGIGIAPQGSTVEYTDKYARQMEGMLMGIPNQQRVFQIVGFPDVTQTIGFTMLADWKDRDQSAQEIAGSPFPPSGLAAQMFMAIPGVMAFTTTPPPLGSQDFLGQPVSFVVQSTGSWEELGATVQKLMAKMAQNPQLTNADSNLKLDKPQLKIDVNRDKVAAVGSSVATVGRTLETMLGGRNVTRFKKGSEQYDVIVQVEDADRRTPGDLSNIFVRGGDGQMVQLSNLVDVKETIAAKELNHFNKLRSATISAGLAPGYPVGEALTWMENALEEVAPESQYDLSGQSREFRESSSDFAMILALAIAFIFLVLAAQFESWVDPLVILLAVPLAMFGAFLALKLTGGSWNIYSQIGIVTLVGLIAKHGILIVEFSN